MKKVISLAALMAATFSAAGLAHADEGPWLVRLRALSMQPDNHNQSTAVTKAAGDVEIDDKIFPEIDFTYFITKNIATELILTYPQKHDVTLGGTKIGTIKHLPPTLTVQYHFLPDGWVRPYVGAGVNYTRIMDVDLTAAGGKLDVDRNSFGFAGQLGVDFKVADNWFVNLDVKYVQIKADDIRVSTGPNKGLHVTDLDVDPMLYSVGVGYRF